MNVKNTNNVLEDEEKILAITIVKLHGTTKAIVIKANETTTLEIPNVVSCRDVLDRLMRGCGCNVLKEKI